MFVNFCQSCLSGASAYETVWRWEVLFALNSFDTTEKRVHCSEHNGPMVDLKVFAIFEWAAMQITESACARSCLLILDHIH